MFFSPTSIGDCWGAGSMTESHPTEFVCPDCGSGYKVVRVQADADLPHRLIHCRVCKHPLTAMDGDGRYRTMVHILPDAAWGDIQAGRASRGYTNPLPLGAQTWAFERKRDWDRGPAWGMLAAGVPLPFREANDERCCSGRCGPSATGRP